ARGTRGARAGAGGARGAAACHASARPAAGAGRGPGVRASAPEGGDPIQSFCLYKGPPTILAPVPSISIGFRIRFLLFLPHSMLFNPWHLFCQISSIKPLFSEF